MKIYRNIVIIVSIAVGFLFSMWLFNVADFMECASNYPVTEEHYDMLKENAIKVAKTLDNNAIEGEGISATHKIDNDMISVQVNSKIATVKAKIPISIQLEKGENIKINSEIKYEDVKWEKTSNIYPKWFYILLLLFMSLVIAWAIYMIFYLNVKFLISKFSKKLK